MITRPTAKTRAFDGALLVDIWATAQYISMLIQRGMKEEGSTGEHLALLAYLDRAGPSTISELASGMGEAFMTMSDRLRKLEKAGEVDHTSHPADGRASLFSISKMGRRRLNKSRVVVDSVGGGIERNLTLPPRTAAAVLRDLRLAVQATYEEE